MAQGKSKRTYIPNPDRRAYYQAIRNVRIHVLKEHEREMAEASFLNRLFLRIRIEREIRRRCRAIPEPRRR